MAIVRATKVRAFIGAVFAIVVLVLFAAVATSMLGMEVPVLSGIAGAIGM